MNMNTYHSELYHHTLNQVEDHVIWLNADCKVVYSNKIDDSLLGQQIGTIIRLSSSQTWQQFLSQMIDSNTIGATVEGHTLFNVGTSNNKSIEGSSSFRVEALYESSDEVKFIIVSDSSETSKYKKYESDLARLNARLSELQLTNRDLANNAQAKDEFLASMSHELRTPLNSILGLCEALLEGVYGQLDQDQHQPIRQVFSNGHHLLSVLSDILNLSKLRAGGISLSLKDLDVEACCFEVLQFFRGEMQKKSLTVNVSIEGVYLLSADERWFKQVLMNLISNAVKFTNPNRKVGIVVGASPKIGYLRVSVWDEGIGIKKENLPRLFQNFVQLDTSLARAYEGTGLGLSIVSQVMKLHGGEVSVESSLGKGSKFHLDFPWLPEQQKTMPNSSNITDLSDLKTVLLVEDSTIDADRIKRYLDETETEVIWDQRGNQALNLARNHSPDMIILDLFLPESSGWDILSKLKQDEYLSDIPVIVCSVLPQDERKIENQLVQGYLQKPFSRRALESTINSITAHIRNNVDNLGKSEHEDSECLSPQASPNPRKALVITANEHHQVNQDDESSKVSPATSHDTVRDQDRDHIGEYKSTNDILIVDDNLSNIQLVSDYLSRKGYKIVTAEDGYQAVQAARAHRPRLILMDVQMPHMDGIEATRHIKADPNVSTIPIFALTALAMPGDRERCLDAGMDEYFTKPVSLRALYKKIKDTIGS